ncbi:hypothetical protein C8J55DRAFT_549463 [Lentinula edodes]|uniref:F-box domain-containing protein n=1 Tax=Lentinula lateritia TaxID=40482 RepID=A0A9W9DPY7_9AGAR|nr:hypothetical protein C8J55DRAFT_549463 [Lentinula edodes]
MAQTKDVSCLPIPEDAESITITLCTKCDDSLHLNVPKFDNNEIMLYLRSGYLPTTSESAVYSSNLSDIQSGIRLCEEALYHLRDLSRVIDEHQMSLNEKANQIRGVISPIRKLPHDILTEIFQYVCCGPEIGVNYLDGHESLPTLGLSRVCFQWHDLVKSTPMLWTSFGSSVRKIVDPDVRPMFKFFLERSYPYPIDFKVSDPSPDYFPWHSFSTPLNENRCHERWRHIFLRSQKQFVELLLQPLFQHQFSLSSLVSLTLNCEAGSFLDFPIPCPNLEALILEKVHLDLRFPRPTITYLNFMNIDSDWVSQVIKYCPNVRELVAEELWIVIDGSEGMEMKPRNVTSPNLCRLILGYGQMTIRHSEMSFIQNLVVPTLTHLELTDHSYRPRVVNVEHLCMMLEQSHSNLTHLTIRGILVEGPNELVHLLQCVSSVTSLELEDHYLIDDARTIRPVLILLVVPWHSGEEGLRVGNISDEDTPRSDEDSDCDPKPQELDYYKTPGEQCLLPRLRDFSLTIRPHRKTLRTLLKVVHSRWIRPETASSSYSVNHQFVVPDTLQMCVCLKKLRVKSTLVTRLPSRVVTERFNGLQKDLEEFKKDGMEIDIEIPEHRLDDPTWRN